MKIEFNSQEEKERLLRVVEAALPRYDWCDLPAVDNSSPDTIWARNQREFLRAVRAVCNQTPVIAGWPLNAGA